MASNSTEQDGARPEPNLTAGQKGHKGSWGHLSWGQLPMPSEGGRTVRIGDPSQGRAACPEQGRGASLLEIQVLLAPPASVWCLPAAFTLASGHSFPQFVPVAREAATPTLILLLCSCGHGPYRGVTQESEWETYLCLDPELGTKHKAKFPDKTLAMQRK